MYLSLLRKAGNRLIHEPILICVTSNSAIINHFSSITVIWSKEICVTRKCIIVQHEVRFVQVISCSLTRVLSFSKNTK